MKKFLALLFLIPVVAGYAQTFEGIINWKMAMEITDPKVKAQMEEAKKKMNDPATQAQMKQMQEKMNDPEMKKLMESNPQIKASMEAAMKMQQGGGLESMMPKGITLKIKGHDLLTHTEGGAYNFDHLYLKDKKESYQINREDKTYSKRTIKDEDLKGVTEQKDVKVTKTSETQKIMGYTCTKYIVDLKENNRDAQQFIWATKEISNLDFKEFSRHTMTGNKNNTYYDQIDGFPLKMEIKMATGTMTMEVTEVKKESLPASDFVIPSDYKETKNVFGN
ncbi:MAG: DUF4412 domain-containing protein [Chryseolinea sp.]